MSKSHSISPPICADFPKLMQITNEVGAVTKCDLLVILAICRHSQVKDNSPTQWGLVKQTMYLCREACQSKAEINPQTTGRNLLW